MFKLKDLPQTGQIAGTIDPSALLSEINTLNQLVFYQRNSCIKQETRQKYYW